MSPRLRSLLAQAGSFVLAAVLLYLALRGVDLGEVLGALERADYRWLPPLVAIVVLSHVLRAWRWKVLIEALPPEPGDEPRPRVTVGHAFGAVMIGYMVNYAAPRLGEVVRTANLSTRLRLPFSAVFGTVIVERVLDMVVLALALASVGFILLDRSATLNDLFIAPLVEQVGRVPALALLGLAAGVAVLVLLLYRQLIVRTDSALALLWRRRVAPVVSSLRNGVLTLKRSRRPGVLVLSTVLMWLCYVLMAHLPFVMLGLSGPYHLTLLDSWAIMTLGALGIVVPSPGGVGSYHYITIQTLVHLFAVDEAAAATYAVLSHAAQLVLYVLLGAACLLAQGASLRSLRAPAPPAAPPAPPTAG